MKVCANFSRVWCVKLVLSSINSRCFKSCGVIYDLVLAGDSLVGWHWGGIS